MKCFFKLLFIASFAVSSACVSIYVPKPQHNLSFAMVADKIIEKRLGIETFQKAGPFTVVEEPDIDLVVGEGEGINADLYLSYQKKDAPLLIFQHGNDADKSVHAKQAKRASSWGFHCLVLSQSSGQGWLQNGKKLAQVISEVYKRPDRFDYPIDRNRIILVGHSFGATAAAVAVGLKAPVRGLVLLDPALFDAKLTPYLKQVNVPTIIIGADQRVFKSKKRHVFFNSIPSEKIEVSVTGSTHNDAQYPSMFRWEHFLGLKQSPRNENQETFTSAIVTAALSFASTGSHVYAWHIFNKHRLRFRNIKRR